LVPVMFKVNAGPPTTAELGLSKVIRGGGTVIVKVKAPEMPPPGAGFDTVTIAVPAAAMSAAVMAACNSVLETKVVVRALPFHCTVEEETKFVPATINVNAAVPTSSELGFKEEIVGTGLSIVKIAAAEVPPPGPGVTTVTIAVPPVTMSAVVMAACRLVLETNVVARALPFHSTVEEDTKSVPLTVSVNAAPPAVVELGFRGAVASEGVGLGGGLVVRLPPPPPEQPIRLPRAPVHSASPANVESDRRKETPSNAAAKNDMPTLITSRSVSEKHAR